MGEGHALEKPLANEIMVPLLPCRDIDEILEFYGTLGFTKTYHQLLPNPIVALKREDINIQFFGMPEFKPEDSYGSCLVIVTTPASSTVHSPMACALRTASSSCPGSHG